MSRALIVLSFVLFVSASMAQTTPKPNQNPAQAAAQNSAQTGAQPPAKKNPLVAYAGNWIGEFEGKPWILVNLNLVGEQFSGSLQRAKSVDLNDNGELKHVSEEIDTDPLVDAKLNPDGLLLTFKAPDTQETFRYMMKLTGDATAAELKMIAMTMPPGMAKPKPWKVMKVIK
jgi:hypothetical protein